jgi:FecR protein
MSGPVGRSLRKVLGAVMCLATVFIADAPAPAQPSVGAQVLLARQPVEVIPQGQTAGRPLAKGGRLGAGDRIRTGQDGAVEVRLGDGSLVRLAESSDLVIDRLEVDPAGAPTTWRFNLVAGQARAAVARQIVTRASVAEGAFAVETPLAVAAVRPMDFAVLHDADAAAVRLTDFAVLHDPDGRTRVYVFASSIETTAIDHGRVLCTRNRWTMVVLGRDPEPCRVIPLREKRALLKGLAFQSVKVDPDDLDKVALDALGVKLSGERTTGGRVFGGTPQRTGREDAAAQEAPVTTRVGD